MPESAGATHAQEWAALQLLGETLRNPALYVERRTDEIRELSTRSVDWTVRLQLRLPSKASAAVPMQIVSLGIFPKKRLPDLVATDGRGFELPLLRRVDRTRALTALLLQNVLDSVRPGKDRERQLAGLAYRFVSEQPDTAIKHFEEYAELLSQVAPETASKEVEAHLEFAQHFVSRTHVLACVEPTTNGYQMISFRYSERHQLPKRPKVTGPARQKFRLLLRYWGMGLGLLAVPFDMRLAGANHAHSYYLLVLPPAGTEIEAIYWKQREHRARGTPSRGSPDSNYIHEAKHEALACYHPEHDVHGGNSGVELRLNGGALGPLWVLTALLVAVGIYLARNTNRDLSNVLSLLAAVPAGLVAFATQTKHELTAELGKWVRRAYLLLSLIAAFAGVALVGDLISDGVAAGVIDDQLIAATLAGYSAVLLPIVSYICFRPPGPAERKQQPGFDTYAGIAAYRAKRRRNSLLVVFGSLLLATLAVVAAYA